LSGSFLPIEARPDELILLSIDVVQASTHYR
jgi:hypothetical protein